MTVGSAEPLPDCGVPPPPLVAGLVGVSAGTEPALEAALEAPDDDEDEDPPEDPAVELDPGFATVLAGVAVGAGETAIRSVRARLSTFALAKEPSTTPNPSIAKIAAAAVRGAGTANPNGWDAERSVVPASGVGAGTVCGGSDWS